MINIIFHDISFVYSTATCSELEALQLEKRNLHSYLKVYERDFSRMHGRPVTKHADIQPVAHEYQRYKVRRLFCIYINTTSGSVYVLYAST